MRSFFRTLSIILLCLWMSVIFYMSAQPAEASSEMSGSVIEIIAQRLYPNFELLSEFEQTEVIASFQFIARKTAHVAIFAVLGFLSFLSFVSYTNMRFFTRIFWSVAISCIYAASDEFHQRFVQGRSCELRDFLLDSIGILSAIVLTALFIKIIPPLRRKTAYIKKQKSAFAQITEPAVSDKAADKVIDTACDPADELRDVISTQQDIIEKLTASLEEKTEEITKIKAENMNNKINSKSQTDLPDEIKYASSVIGKAVIEVTKVCNRLLTEAKDDNAKELVNLALGRNEVFKANVLKILSQDINSAEKQAQIEKEKCEAFDYFDSIIAQIC